MVPGGEAEPVTPAPRSDLGSLKPTAELPEMNTDAASYRPPVPDGERVVQDVAAALDDMEVPRGISERMHNGGERYTQTGYHVHRDGMRGHITVRYRAKGETDRGHRDVNGTSGRSQQQRREAARAEQERLRAELEARGFITRDTEPWEQNQPHRAGAFHITGRRRLDEQSAAS